MNSTLFFIIYYQCSGVDINFFTACPIVWNKILIEDAKLWVFINTVKTCYNDTI